MNKTKAVILAVLFLSFAWPVRGQFGHLKGALIPGALAAAALSLGAGTAESRRSFALAVILGSAGFSLGGHLASGKMLDAVLSAPHYFGEPLKLLKLFRVGILAGGLGSFFLAFAYSEKPLTKRDFFLFLFLALAWFIPLGIFNLESLDIPLYSAGLAILVLYSALVKKSRNVTALGLVGTIGFGGAYLAAILILNAGHRGYFGHGWPWWNLRDQIHGAIGGGVLMGTALKLFPENPPAPGWADKVWIQKAGFMFLTIYIPALNTSDVLLYWTRYSYLFPFQVILLVVAALSFFVWFIVTARAGAESFAGSALQKKIFASLVYFIWYLTGIAILKELMAFGWTRWEPAYTLFLAEGAVLTFMLADERAAGCPPAFFR